MSTASYERLAALLTYPDSDYRSRVEATVAAASAGRESLLAFADQTAALSTQALQELFTVSFDLGPLCSLEIGWHLFAENYERGLLMVRIRQEMRRAGVRENHELPDHLTNVLPLIARMEHDRAADFIGACVLPAVQKMWLAIRGKQNPFEHVITAIYELLHADFPEIPLTCTEPHLHVLCEEVGL